VLVPLLGSAGEIDNDGEWHLEFFLGRTRSLSVFWMGRVRIRHVHSEGGQSSAGRALTRHVSLIEHPSADLGREVRRS
jgi:hypothetical protein